MNAVSQKTTPITNNVTWTVEAPANGGGVSINASGEVTVDAKAKAGVYTIKAGAKDGLSQGSGSATLTVERATPAVQSIAIYQDGKKLDGTGTIIIPATGAADNTYGYSVKSVDQYGDEASVNDPNWEFTGANDKVTFANGTVTVKAGAGKNSTYTLKATTGSAPDQKTASVTLTAKDIDISAPTVKIKENPTYGDTWAQIVTLTGGSASLNGANVPGTFSVKETGTPNAGDQTFNVVFNSTNGEYKDVAVTGIINTVNIAKKSITVTADNKIKGFGDANPPLTWTVAASDLVGTDTRDVLTVNLTCDATDDSPAGTPVAITGTGSATNYTVSVTPGTLTITKANITSITTTAPGDQSILANDTTSNASLETLKTKLGLPATVSVAYGNGKSGTVSMNWDADKTFNIKGDVYTFTGTVVPGTDFNPTNLTLTSKITVTPVKITAIEGMEGAVTYSKAQVLAANALTDLGLPANVTLKFDNSVADQTLTAHFDKDLTAVKGVANQVDASADKSVTLVLQQDNFPGWATLAVDVPQTVINITNKYPIPAANITFAPISVTFGTDYTPTASVDTTAHSEYAGVTYTYTYTKDGTTVSKPTDAGSYTMVVTVENDNYKGTKTATLTISPKALTDAMVTAIPNQTFSGKPYTPELTIKDGETALVLDTDYTVEYTNNTNAGTATATITGKGNYKGEVVKNFTIDQLSLNAKTEADAPRTTVTGLAAAGYTYTGSAITPKVNVAVEGIGNLKEGVDYETLTYTNNTNATTGETLATVVIVGKGNYKDTLTPAPTFKINKAGLTGKVTISGTASGADNKYQNGDVLTADISKLEIADESKVTFQWYRGDTAIDGQTAKTYTLKSPDDDGKNISVKVTAKDEPGINYTGTVTSGSVAVGKKSTAGLTAVLQVVLDENGNAELTAVIKDSEGNEVTGFTFKWYRDGKLIVGVTGKTYNAGPADAGHTITYVAESPDYADATASKNVDGEGKDIADSNGNYKSPATNPVISVTKSEGDKTVTLSWSASVIGSESIQNWLVTFGDGTEEILDPTVTSKTYSDLTNGTEYTYKVKAINSANLTSDEVSGTATPKAPSSGGGSSSGGGWWTHPTTTNKNSVNVTSKSDRHGSVSLSNSKPSTGSTVTITVKPDKDYEVDEVRVTDSDGRNVAVKDIGNNKFTFKMPAGTVDVDVTYKQVEIPPEGFTDVPDNYWAKAAIEWVNENGYMKGNSETTFNPDGRVTRQQLWMILARMAGAEPYDFTDAKNWAISNGISDGSNPGNSVTRQQMVTILYRYAQMQGYTTTGGTDISSFPDSNAVAAYAEEAISWSVGNSIVGGTTDGRLNPNGTATRAQFATILQRFYNTVTW